MSSPDHPDGIASSFERWAPDGETLAPESKLECGICWHVYDPAVGDDYWQIAPGTPFSALPEHWSCPNCDALRERFLPLEPPAEPSGLQTLLSCYAAIAETMQNQVPLCHPGLTVAATGFRPWGDGWLGIIITPWFMNLVHMTDTHGSEHRRQGDKTVYDLPAGRYEFVTGEVKGWGWLESCSLVSPMTGFADQAAALATAEAALAALFDPALLDEDAQDPATLANAANPLTLPSNSALNRRSFLRAAWRNRDTTKANNSQGETP